MIKKFLAAIRRKLKQRQDNKTEAEKWSSLFSGF